MERPTRTKRPARPEKDEFYPSSNSHPAELAEQELTVFINENIEKMQKYASLGSGMEPTFTDLNNALMNYSKVQYSLLSLHNLARLDHKRQQEEYDEWFAEKYLIIRGEVNPTSLSAQKWLSQKEIEMMVRRRFREDYKEKTWSLHTTEHRLNFLRRLIDSWDRHSFVINMLSKNLQSEVNANLRSVNNGEEASTYGMNA